VSSTIFLFQTLNAISLAGLLFFLASGFTLIFGLMRIVNLSHGAFFLLAGYLGITTIRITGSFWLALLITPMLTALIGFLLERFLLRRVRGDAEAEVLITVGIIFIFADMSLVIWGGDPQTVPLPDILRGSVSVLGVVTYPKYRFFVMIFALLAGTFLFLLMGRTRVGAMVRAGVDDRATAAALGINIQTVFTGVFVLGTTLAGLGGVIGGALLTVTPLLDIEVLLFSLAVVIIGGLGSLPGAVVGALIVGFADAFGRALLPELSYFTLFAPMALILVFKPSGLLGKV
jgi:branched-chain amino acid transport system permease protein